MSSSFIKGVEAEERAKSFLECKGLQHVATRFRTPGGEVDLIMKTSDTFVFVEVKQRKTLRDAIEAISKKQQRRIIESAQYFIDTQDHAARNAFIRFDIVLLSAHQIQHVEQAFDATDDF